MTAISKPFTAITDSQIDVDSPIDTVLMTSLRDSLINLREWLGANYVAGAVQNHNHDGANSALVRIGANSLRNGSFESGTESWTTTQYTGGTIAVNTANHMDGANALAITSTILANGGGDVISTEYEACAGGELYALRGSVKSSVANVSCRVEIIWYDNAQAQISASTLFSSLNTATTKTNIDTSIVSPATARYKRLKLIGGVPALGSAVGTIYFDGLVAYASAVVPAGTIIDYAGTTAPPGYLVAPLAATNISRTAYAGLFAAIGTQWGAGDGSTTFGCPWFPDGYVARQANGNVGTSTVGAVISHSHGINGTNNISGSNWASLMASTQTPGMSTDATGASANYAAAMNLLKCVKY